MWCSANVFVLPGNFNCGDWIVTTWATLSGSRLHKKVFWCKSWTLIKVKYKICLNQYCWTSQLLLLNSTRYVTQRSNGYSSDNWTYHTYQLSPVSNRYKKIPRSKPCFYQKKYQKRWTITRQLTHLALKYTIETISKLIEWLKVTPFYATSKPVDQSIPKMHNIREEYLLHF